MSIHAHFVLTGILTHKVGQTDEGSLVGLRMQVSVCSGYDL